MIDYNKIAYKIQSMIKDKIRQEGLVKTGRLINSIKVIPTKTGEFKIEAEDYFKYLDEEHHISSSVFNSNELKIFIETVMAEGIEEELDKKLKNKSK